jgi:hypothetical protein
MTAVPAGFILSLIGVIRDKTKWPSIAGLAVSGLLAAMFIVSLLMAALQFR